MADELPVPAPAPLAPERLSASAIQAALRAGRPADVAAALAGVSPVRRAELFLQLRTAEQTAILAASPAELSATILADCDSASLRPTLSSIDLASITPALRLIPPDDLADILLHLAPERAREVESVLDPALLDEVRPLLRFDPDTAGGLMTPRYLSVPEAVSAAKAIEILRRSRLGDSPSYVYVVDPGGRLAGTLPLRTLFVADPRALVRDLASREIVKIGAGTPRAEIVRTFGQYHYAALPVVDERERLVGIVTADDILAEMRRTEGQVVHGVTGADPREALQATLAGARSRVPWVTVTLLGGLGCAFIAARFQRTLEEFLVLGLFIPVVLALAESVAAQTISVALSALMGGDVPRAKLAGFVAKELLIGAAVGLYAGTGVALASLLWHGDPRLGLLIGGATGISVAWATLLGVLIPALALRLRVNPAFASGPLVLALADLSTLGVYLGGATLLLAT